MKKYNEFFIVYAAMDKARSNGWLLAFTLDARYMICWERKKDISDLTFAKAEVNGSPSHKEFKRHRPSRSKIIERRTSSSPLTQHATRPMSDTRVNLHQPHTEWEGWGYPAKKTAC